jgi:hypothetical protein
MSIALNFTVHSASTMHVCTAVAAVAVFALQQPANVESTCLTALSVHMQGANQAAQQADCVLITHAQLATAAAAFPFSTFGLLLQYVGPSLSDAVSAGDTPANAATAADMSCPGAYLSRVLQMDHSPSYIYA